MKNLTAHLLKLNFRVLLTVLGIFFTIALENTYAQPVLQFCPGTVSGFTDVNGFRNFNCTDIEFLFLDEPVTYSLDTNANLISGSISTMQADSMFKYISGFAEFSGINMGCNGMNIITVTVEDSWTTYVVGDGMEEVITRRFTATCDGNLSQVICYQDIYIEDCGFTLEFCPGTVSGFSDFNGFRNFNCNDVQDILFSNPVTYQLDRNGNLIANSFSSSQAAYVMKYRTGFAEFNGLCETGVITVTATDNILYGVAGGTTAEITRVFRAADCMGVVSNDVCFQTIIFEDCPRPIPTLSQWGIILLGMIMLIFGVVGVRKRKTIFG